MTMIEKIDNHFENAVKIFKLKKYKDKRGFFSETYNTKNLNEIGITDSFVQDNESFSKSKGVLRGLHFQENPFSQAKIIRVLSGKIQDVVVDLRLKSKTYGKYKSFILDSINNLQLYVPIGFAHGFLVLEKNTHVVYKVSNYYNPSYEKTIIFNDYDIDIDWLINHKKIILSDKDSNGIQLNNYKSTF